MEPTVHISLSKTIKAGLDITQRHALTAQDISFTHQLHTSRGCQLKFTQLLYSCAFKQRVFINLGAVTALSGTTVYFSNTNKACTLLQRHYLYLGEDFLAPK